MANKKITELPAATLPILGSGARIELVQGGINVQTDPDNIGGGGTSIPFGSTTGTNSYSATMSPVVSAYADGAMYHIRVGNSSTSTVTFNLGPGAKKAFVTDGSQAQGGHFLAGVDYLITYKSSLDSGAGGFQVVNELIHGLMNFRGTFDASGNNYPSAGGSGPSASVRHGDFWVASVAGVPSAGRVLKVGDFVFTGVDAPGQTASNWYIINNQKLYTSTGSNTDGSMDQNSITNLFGVSGAFIDGEVPGGSVNSSNTAFTLANTPIVGSVKIYLNGIRQKVAVDYTISGATITYLVAPTTGDLLVADYRR